MADRHYRDVLPARQSEPRAGEVPGSVSHESRVMALLCDAALCAPCGDALLRQVDDAIGRIDAGVFLPPDEARTRHLRLCVVC